MGCGMSLFGIKRLRSNTRVKLPSPSRRALTWRATGVVALRDEGITEIPNAAIEIGQNIRTLDASNNKVQQLPERIANLKGLQRLNLSSNCIYHISDRLCALSRLRILVLDHNQITELPTSIGRLSNLEQLTLSSNKLTTIPESIGYMTRLQVLLLSDNNITKIPETIGGCISLTELNCMNNSLIELPMYLGKLKALKTLVLDNNCITSLPKKLLEECSQLQTLSIHGNPISAETLQAMPHFEDYDKRRCLKYDKQIFGGAMKQRMGFDEGFDREI